jgi:hypothetical protein
MKKILYFIFAILLIYCLFWFSIANYASKNLPKKLNDLKSQNLSFEFEEIKVKGFPFEFRFEIIKPVIRVSDAGLSLKINFDKQFNLHAGLFLNTIKLSSSGDFYTKLILNNETYNIKSSAIRNTIYSINLKENPLSEKFIKSLINDSNFIDKIFTLVSEIEVSGGGIKNILLDSGKSLWSIDNLETIIQLQSFDQEKVKIGIKNTVKNGIFSDSSNNLVKKIFSTQTLKPVTQSLGANLLDYFDVYNLSARGVINQKIIADAEIFTNQNKTKLDIEKLAWNDSISNIDISGKFAYKTNPNTPLSLKANFRYECTYTENWYKLTEIYLQRIIANKNNSNQRNQNAIEALLSKISQNFSSNNSRKLTPEWHKKGVLKIIADATIMPDEHESYLADINKLNIENAVYKFGIKGNYSSKGQNPAYNLKIDVSNYLLLIDDLISYAKQATKFGAGFSIFGSEKIEFTNDINQKLKVFFREISQNPQADSDTISLFLVSDGRSLFPAAGNYSSEEIAMKWNKLVLEVAINEATKNINKIIPKNSQEAKKKLTDIIESKVPGLGQIIGGLINEDGKNN